MTTSTTTTVQGVRGDLFVRTWSADSGRYAVLLAHGVAEHTGRYAHVAEHLLAHGPPW